MGFLWSNFKDKSLSFAVGRPRAVAMPMVCAGQMGPPYSLFVWTTARLYASALLSLGYIHTFFIFQNKNKHTQNSCSPASSSMIMI